jgi:protein-disulfide isomerase
MYLLLFRLPAICPLCVATHVINFLLLLCTVLLWPRAAVAGADGAPAAAPRPGFKQAVMAGLLVVMVVFAVFAGFTAQNYGEVRGYANALEAKVRLYEGTEVYKKELWDKTYKELFAQKKYDIPIDPDDPIYGSPDARRTLVMFGDFQCPPCKALHDHIRKIWPWLRDGTASQGGIRLVFKHYPLYARCNARSATNAHAYSCDAALAAEAARIVGGPEAFWKMADALFARQKDLDLAPYAELAQEIGLDVAKFEAVRRSPEAAARLERHVKEGAVAEMSSTPGIFLDGVSVRDIALAGWQFWLKVLRQPNWPGLSPPVATQDGGDRERRGPATQPVSGE